jgi:flavin-dependent amine oxidoreductase
MCQFRRFIFGQIRPSFGRACVSLLVMSSGAPGLEAEVERQGDDGLLAQQPVDPWRVFVLAVGQYTRFAGSEYQRSNNYHFCGEHTSIDSQGYLNGAVETGQRAAADVWRT